MKRCQTCGVPFTTKGYWCEKATCGGEPNPWSGISGQSTERLNRQRKPVDVPDALILPKQNEVTRISKDNKGKGGWQQRPWVKRKEV